MSKTSGTSGTAWHFLAATLFSSGTRCVFVSRMGQRKALRRLPYRVYRKMYRYLFLHLAREERVIASFAFVLRDRKGGPKRHRAKPIPLLKLKGDFMKREVIIPFRVSEREKQALEKKAAACGWSLSDYIRTCISGKHVTVVQGVDALTDELRRIGNNLNQLTRHANTGFVDVIDLSETKREVARIWQLLNSLCREAR